MANPVKGEVDFVVGDKTYTLCFTTNAMVETETIFGGRDVVAVVVEWQGSPNLATLRGLLWGALRKHHGEMSLFDAGDLIDEVGAERIGEIGEAIGRAIRFRLSGSFAEATAKPGRRAK